MAKAPLDLTTVGEIYLDESSQTKHRFLALGGLIIGAEFTATLTAALEKARLPELPQGELAWVKVSKTKLAAYRRFVDVFFDKPIDDALDFHTVIVDTTKLKDKVFNEGSREIGFNKEIFQLCSKFARLYPLVPIFHVYPDRRQTPSSPEELRLILNRARTKSGDARDWPFRRVHFREGVDSQALQLVDVLLGALAYRLNGHHEQPGASPAKADLSAHVLKRAGIKNVYVDTAIRGRFTVWHRQLK